MRKIGRGGQTAGGIGVAARAISTLRSPFNHARHLGKVMTPMESESEHPTGLSAIRAMLLTGFRRMEVLAMRKEWVQPDDNLVRIPDTKSGPQMRVAGDAAMNRLEEQAMRSHSTFVFPADWGDGHFIGVVRVLDQVCARAGLKDVTPHTPRGVTQRYVHLDTAQIIAADQVAAQTARLLDGGELRSVREIKQARTLASLRAVA